MSIIRRLRHFFDPNQQDDWVLIWEKPETNALVPITAASPVPEPFREPPWWAEHVEDFLINRRINRRR